MKIGRLQTKWYDGTMVQCLSVIPIYQRLFVWEKNEINKLLDDLYNAFTKNPDTPYYIGVITVWVNKEGILEIVDGQQRLTFLTLFGCEMQRDYDLETNWKSFIQLDDESLRIHYVGRPEDENDIKDYLKEGTYSQNPNFKIFRDCFEVFSRNKEDLNGLSRYVFSKTSFLINYLPSSYKPFDLNLYFEKMNSTGIQLTPLEQLKGRFSNYADRWNKCIYVDEITAKEVGELNGMVTLADIMHYEPNDEQRKEWVEAVSKSSSVLRVKHRIIKPEIVVLHTLSLLLPSEDISFEERHLLETFQKLDDNRKEEFITLLEKYTAWIDSNIIHIKEEQEGQLMPYAIGQASDDNEENVFDDKRRFIQYQSMLFVSGYESQKWILDVYKQCNFGAYPLDLKTLMDWDKGKHSNLGEMPNWYYGQNLLQIFTRLDYCLWEYVCYPNSTTLQYEPPIELTQVEKEAVKAYLFKRNSFSVEHFHPQTDATKSSNIPLWNAEYTEQDRKYNCAIPKDGFGNLALISAGRNSEYSNGSVAEKYDRITKLVQEKRLESIKLLFMCKACDGKDEKWTPKTADKLGMAMYQLLRENGYSK